MQPKAHKTAIVPRHEARKGQHPQASHRQSSMWEAGWFTESRSTQHNAGGQIRWRDSVGRAL